MYATIIWARGLTHYYLRFVRSSCYRRESDAPSTRPNKHNTIIMMMMMIRTHRGRFFHTWPQTQTATETEESEQKPGEKRWDQAWSGGSGSDSLHLTWLTGWLRSSQPWLGPRPIMAPVPIAARLAAANRRGPLDCIMARPNSTPLHDNPLNRA